MFKNYLILYSNFSHSSFNFSTSSCTFFNNFFFCRVCQAGRSSHRGHKLYLLQPDTNQTHNKVLLTFKHCARLTRKCAHFTSTISTVNSFPLVSYLLVSYLLAVEVEATGLVGSSCKISIIAVETMETF